MVPGALPVPATDETPKQDDDGSKLAACLHRWRMARQRNGKRDTSSSSSSVQPSALCCSSRRRCLLRMLLMAAVLEMIVIFQIPSLSIVMIDSYNHHHLDQVHRQHQVIASNIDNEDTTSTFTNNIIRSARVAYVVSITHCNWELIEAAAIHGHSIDLAQYHYNNHTVIINSTTKVTLSLSHTRHAMVHPDAEACIPILRQVLKYQIHVKAVPLSLDSIQSPALRQVIDAENAGCCGAKELLKLYAYTLEEHDVVIHLDTDVLVFRPPWDVIADMLIDKTGTNRHQSLWSKIEPLRLKQPSSSSSTRPDFFFTRDYLQASYFHHSPEKFAVQGGMFVLRPNRTVFDDLIITIQQSNYTSQAGWGKQGFGGYWGAAQIQGLLSYYYYRPQQQGTAVELNRCYYNNMGSEQPRWYNVPKKAKFEGQCTTLQETCQDCRNVSLSEIVFAHFTMCNKPWKCLRKVRPDSTNLCYALHQAWFAVRESLERQEPYAATRIRWPMQLQSRLVHRPFWTNATLSYCTNPNITTGYRPKRGKYHSLVFHNISSLITTDLIPRLTPTKPRKHNNRTKKIVTQQESSRGKQRKML